MKPKAIPSKGNSGKSVLYGFLPYLRPYWKEILLAPFLMVVEVICDLMQPHLLARMVDAGIAKGDTHLILRTGMLMVGIALLGMLGGVGCTFLQAVPVRALELSCALQCFAKFSLSLFPILTALLLPL